MYPVQTSAPVGGAAVLDRPVNEATRQAQQDAMLAPRFYTTDFAALEKIDVAPMRAEWDALIAEFRADPNRTHFRRTPEFESDFPDMPARQAFVDFLVSSITAEFSGCILYAEIQKRVKNPDVKELFQAMSRDEGRHAGFINGTLKEMNVGVDLSFLQKVKKYTFFKPKYIYYATYLSEKIGYARYITIFRRIQAHPEYRVHPIFDWFENWCNDEFRHGEAFAVLMRVQPEVLRGVNKLWIRFFLLAVFSTMYVRDHLREDFYRAIGWDPTEYDFEVFRKTTHIARQVFPLALDVDNPRFRERLDRMAENTRAMHASAGDAGLGAKLRRARLALGNAAAFAGLFFMRTLPNTPPADVRMEPMY
jgi:magnesium-protoporphyrin IX monomethyl ester (oxidative) cyclase